MDYLRIYNELIERGKNRILEGYYERHHIVPKCIRKDNTKENLVNLTAREHFIAHWLLSRIYPEEGKLAQAFWMMCNMRGNGKRDYKVSSRTYEEAKISSNKYLSEIMSGEMRKECYSTPECRKKISNKLKQLWEDPDLRKTQSLKQKERWGNPEILSIQSKRLKDKWEDPDFIKAHSERLKQKWLDPVYREKMSNISKNKKRTKYTKEIIIEVQKMFADGFSGPYISEKTGISLSAVYNMKNNKNYIV